MKRITKLGWAVALAMVWVGVAGVGAAWAGKIGLVDTAKVVKEYQKTKDAQTRLEKEFEDKKSELKKLNDKLEKQQQELTAKKGIVSQKQYDGLKSKFDDDQENFREKYKEIQGTFMKKQRDLMESIVNDIKEIVAQIAKSEKYDAVFDKEVLLYGGEDITYKVLDQLNKKK
ncbi:MAG: OmpH family outer membrane protein [Candidatus Firestonebacteria bacterium]|nr:OmpH family outer membrane protein [Candidatus Firestonebacteria bacterium]